MPFFVPPPDAPLAAPRQCEIDPGAPASAAGAVQGVTIYRPAFFAAFRPANAFDMVQRIPGFTFQEGSAVRGYNGSAGNVLVDGQRPATKSDSLETILTRIGVEKVECIEGVATTAAGVDLQGWTVVANVVLRHGGVRPSGALEVAGAFARDGRRTTGFVAERSWRTGAAALDVALSAQTYIDDFDGDGARRTLTVATGLVQPARADIDDGGYMRAFGLGARAPTMGGELRASLSLHDDLYSSQESYASGTSPTERDTETDRQASGEVGVHFERPLSARSRFELVAGEQLKTHRDVAGFVTPGEALTSQLRATSSESILRGMVSVDLSNGLSTRAGVEAVFNVLTSHTRIVENGAPVALPGADVRVGEWRGEAFASADWRPFPGWAIEAGLRFEASTIGETGDTRLTRSFAFAKPRLQVTWTPSTGRRVHLRWEREVGQLDFTAFASSVSGGVGTVNLGNPNLHPPISMVTELGFEQRIFSDGALAITLRRAEIDGVIDRIPIGVDQDAPGNIGPGRQESLDVALTLPLDRLGMPKAVLKSNATWRDSEVTDAFTGAKRRISGEYPREGKAELIRDVPSWRLLWGVNSTFGRQQVEFRANEIRRSVQAPWVNAYVDWRLLPGAVLHLELANLTARTRDRERILYTDTRATGAVDTVERLRVRTAPRLFARLRWTY